MARPKNFDADEVLTKAREVFWRRGYKATSIQDLVAATGVNRQSLYDTYGDKHALYLASLKHFQQQNETSLKRHFAQGQPVKQAMAALLQSVIEEAMADDYCKGCFMNNAMVETAIHHADVAAITAYNQQMVERLFTKLFKQAQDGGEISSRFRPQELARFFFSSLNGLRAVSKTVSDRRALQDIVKVSLAVLN